MVLKGLKEGLFDNEGGLSLHTCHCLTTTAKGKFSGAVLAKGKKSFSISLVIPFAARSHLSRCKRQDARNKENVLYHVINNHFLIQGV